MSLLDVIVFVVFLLGSTAFAFWMAARKGGQSAEGYFRADKTLPWYVVGASIISSGVSSEQFIGTVGIAYLYGMAISNYQWGAVIVYTLLIFVFLPFYMRGNVTTMPEFLERRFNVTCRRIYAGVSLFNMVIVLLGITMLAGAKALTVLFPDHVSMVGGICALALLSAVYTVYGGLLSSVWADVIQYVVLMGGGLIVGLYSLHYCGGLGNLLDSMPEKAIMLYDSQHEIIPWFGLLALLFSVGIWYNCANQMIVQRFLGARSEWDARMGVVMAGFSMAVFPLLIVIPGIAAFYLFHDKLADGDQAWPYLVKHLLPSGMVGVVLAGLAGSVLGTLAAIANSASTIFTYDIYKNIINKEADDKRLFNIGRISTASFYVFGIAMAIYLSESNVPIFVMIQQAFSYAAAPIAAVFLVGILWRRATSDAATIAMIIGFIAIYPVVNYLFGIPQLKPYDSYPHHTFVVFLLTIVLVIVLSLFTRPKSAEELKGVIWNKSALSLPPEEQKLNRGIRDFRLWWFLMIVVISTLYFLTYSRANKSKWLEAEKIAFKAQGGTGEVQKRDKLEKFTLWTNSHQVLFKPAGSGASIEFEVPAKTAGNYKLATVVTRGPEYGKFSAAVNETTATIQRNVTTQDGKKYSVDQESMAVYDANTKINDSMTSAEKAMHVVDRLDLGVFALREGVNRLTFVSEDLVPGGPGAIGVDQVIITPVKN